MEKTEMLKHGGANGGLGNLSAIHYEQVELRCWELLKSSDLPPTGFML